METACICMHFQTIKCLMPILYILRINLLMVANSSYDSKFTAIYGHSSTAFLIEDKVLVSITYQL